MLSIKTTQLRANYSKTNIRPVIYEKERQKRIGVLTPEAEEKIALRQIPDLSKICLGFYRNLTRLNSSGQALEFLSTFNQLDGLNVHDLEKVIDHEDSSHVLVQNEYMKVVLIRWEPGAQSSIHGHPDGGCVFKVLHGSLEELRYTPSEHPKLLGVNRMHQGGVGFIQDALGYHAVGNGSNKIAVSLHAYATGKI